MVIWIHSCSYIYDICWLDFNLIVINFLHYQETGFYYLDKTCFVEHRSGKDSVINIIIDFYSLFKITSI